ncbi:hypothetical protein ACET3Z_008930 [Daucus carota]
MESPIAKHRKLVLNNNALMPMTKSGLAMKGRIVQLRTNHFKVVMFSELYPEACKFWDVKWNPKFVVIITQKNHHTSYVHPGTVIDNTICHAQNNDFYLCAQIAITGTTRPTHYHVLLNQVGFSPDDLQELVHSLSYVCSSIFCSLDSYSDREVHASSSHGGGITAAEPVPIPQLPRLHKDVCNSMFFV